jgi:hypothetical protein
LTSKQVNPAKKVKTGKEEFHGSNPLQYKHQNKPWSKIFEIDRQIFSSWAPPQENLQQKEVKL